MLKFPRGGVTKFVRFFLHGYKSNGRIEDEPQINRRNDKIVFV